VGMCHGIRYRRKEDHVASRGRWMLQNREEGQDCSVPGDWIARRYWKIAQSTTVVKWW